MDYPLVEIDGMISYHHCLSPWDSNQVKVTIMYGTEEALDYMTTLVHILMTS